jgi:hypothetical protein
MKEEENSEREKLGSTGIKQREKRKQCEIEEQKSIKA